MIAFLGLFAPATASAANYAVQTFEAGSLILPVDACYARSLGGPGNDTDVNIVIAPATQAQLECDSSIERDEGALYTYGLVMRLVANGVPVHWIIKPGKTGWHDVDFEIRPGSFVRRSDFLTGNETSKYSGVTAVQYRGGPFIIAAADVPAARALMNTANFTTYKNGGVGPHVAKQQFDAPVFTTIYSLPKIAILDVETKSDFTGGDLSTHVQAMNDVGLAWGQNTWWFVMSPADMRAGKLISQNFAMLWVPPIATFKPANKAANIAAIVNFLTASTPGYVLFQDTSIWAMEGELATATSRLWANTQHSPTPLKINGLSGTYGGNRSTELLRSDDYSDPFAQHGGAPWQGVGGANKAEWQPSGGPTAYNSGVIDAVYSYHTTDTTQRYWELASWRWYENNPAYGKVLYTGGDNLRRNTFSPYRILLNSLLLQPSVSVAPAVAQSIPTMVQVTRAAPTVGNTIATVVTVTQGTYELETPTPAVTTYTGTASESAFEFPYSKGHFFGVNGEDFSGSVNYDEVVKIFDADTYLKNLFNPTTQRHIFTTLGSGHLPGGTTDLADNDTSAEALKVALSRPSPTTNFTAAEARGLIRRLFAGEVLSATTSRARLGGVDRSSAVIVGASRVAGPPRPTMLYFGAADGMIHAVCANDNPQVAPCTQVGQELWAFIPKGQLGRLWNNTQKIDGSPGALDAFEDFDGDGLREWKTILVFQTGNPYGQPEAYAIDVTNPDPSTTRGGFAPVSVIWRRDLPGSGLAAAVGPVQRGANFVYMGFFLTNNGRDSATGVPNTAGIRVTAVELKNGSFATSTATDEIATRGFSFLRTYPIGSRSMDATDLNALATGIVDGAAAVDMEDGGTITHLVFGTLTGELFRIPATGTGTVSTSLTPLFKFEDNYHPIGSSPTIFREVNGQFHAAVVTGGYADPVMTSWSPLTTEQFIASVELDFTGNTIVAPATPSGAIAGLDFKTSLGVGERAYGAATRVGDAIFVTTQNASDDVNAASYGSPAIPGKLHQFTLTGTLASDVISIAGGAASVSVVPADKIYVAGGSKMEEVVAAVPVGEGRSAEMTFIIKNIRKLWLKLE